MRTPRGLAFAFVAAGVAIILIWFVALYRPQGSRISELNDEIAAAEGEEQSLSATLARLQAIDADRPALEAELRRLTAAVPPTPELAGFILAAHDAAAEAGIDFMSIAPAPPAPADGQPGLAVVALGITAEGRYFTVLDFLHRLEELERALVVDSVTLARLAPAPPEAPEAPQAGAAAFGAGGVPLTFQAGDPAFQGTFAATPQVGPEGTGTTGGAVDGVQPRAVAQSLHDALRAQVVGEHRVAIELQARAFTTAVPASAEADVPVETTTTTAPADGESLPGPSRRT